MLTGVGILLERMKTNPEEFIEGDASKWSRVMGRGWDIFTEEERTALQDALTEAKREHFNGEVMRVLAQGHDDQLVRADDYLVKQSAVISKKSMMNQTTKLLSDEFDKAYANSSPYQQRK
jgi:phytoene/squalene synthetase